MGEPSTSTSRPVQATEGETRRPDAPGAGAVRIRWIGREVVPSVGSRVVDGERLEADRIGLVDPGGRGPRSEPNATTDGPVETAPSTCSNGDVARASHRPDGVSSSLVPAGSPWALRLPPNTRIPWGVHTAVWS